MAMPYDAKPGEVRVTRHGDSNDRVATVLPGLGYTSDMPLLYFTGRALLQRIRDAETPLVVAKSLGTLAIPLCAGTSIAGIWLTRC